jgi:uncharacterized protein (DUF362 family)/Pyruvate/2-oxoacid:ferredoxin oxidoreductase delta subunit
MPAVTIVRCENYEKSALSSALKKALDLQGGMSKFVKSGDKVLLKVNLLSARSPEKCVTTHPDFVKEVARLVKAEGGMPFIADSPALDSFKRVSAKTGMDSVAGSLGLEVLELSNPIPVRAPEGALFKNIEIASQAIEADVVINLPKLKTHSQMLLTLGVKNLFGTIVAQRKAEWHHMAGVNRDTFASLLLDIYQVVKPALTILDGIWGMEGHGPSNGTPKKIGIIGAAEDAVALDVAICRTLGAPPRMFPLYRVARSRGLGETDMEKITLNGDPPEDMHFDNFAFPALDSMGILPEYFDWFTRRYLVSKPAHRRNYCVGCGQCAQICPADAVKLKDKKIFFDYNKCIRCYCCQEVCPEDAIEFKKGLILRILNRFNR